MPSSVFLHASFFEYMPVPPFTGETGDFQMLNIKDAALVLRLGQKSIRVTGFLFWGSVASSFLAWGSSSLLEQTLTHFIVIGCTIDAFSGS